MNGIANLPARLRRGTPTSAPSVLCGVAVLVATLAATVALALYGGLDRRADRAAWREPAAAQADATMLRRVSVDAFEGRPIHRVELAELTPGTGTFPPGVDRLPSPGEVVVSPALAELIDTHPPGELGDRFGSVIGTIGGDGLRSPGELVAVVGADPVVLQADDASIGITTFATDSTDDRLALYRIIAIPLLVLVLTPAVLLISTSARLTAASTSRRLAALRLAGATPAQTRQVAIAQLAVGAVTGALAGAALGWLLAPALAGLHLAGGPFFAADLVPGLGLLATVAAGAVATTIGVTVRALRRVTTSPLAVATDLAQRPPRSSRLALFAIPAAVLVLAAGATGATVLLVFAVVLGAVILAVHHSGPLVTAAVGRAMSRGARAPSTLIAGRRLAHDPRGAYRVISGLVVTGVIAGIAVGALSSVTGIDAAPDGAPELSGLVSSTQADALREAAPSIEAAAPGTQIEIDVMAPDLVDVTLRPGPDVSIERVRTLVQPHLDGQTLHTATDDLFGTATALGDFRRISILVVAFGVVVGGVSATVAAIGAVVEQRRAIGRLVLAGTPVAVLQRAQRWRTMVPLVLGSAGSVAIGIGCAVVMGRIIGFQAGVEPATAVLVGGLVLVAAVIGWGAAMAARPGLRAAAAPPGSGQRVAQNRMRLKG